LRNVQSTYSGSSRDRQGDSAFSATRRWVLSAPSYHEARSNKKQLLPTATRPADDTFVIEPSTPLYCPSIPHHQCLEPATRQFLFARLMNCLPSHTFQLVIDGETNSRWNDLITLELVEFCEQIFPMIQETRYHAPRDRLPRSHHFFAPQIHCMNDDRFISFFWMSRSTFKDLVGMIDDAVFKNNSQVPQSHPSIQMAVALY
jgi:hypothetical protein